MPTLHTRSAETDDRGIYRAYGVPAGRYTVSANSAVDLLVMVGSTGSGTAYHPGVADRRRATVVEVTAGVETTNIDIRMLPSDKTFTISGRVIDGTTGKPVAEVPVSYMPSGGEGSFGLLPTLSNARGEFRIEGVKSGTYMLVAQASLGILFDPTNTKAENNLYSESSKVEVKSDVSGVEIRMKRGSTVSGVVAFDRDLSDAGERLSKMMIVAMSSNIDGPETSDAGFSSSGVAADGRFQLRGLAPGKVELQLFSTFGQHAVTVRKIERDGLVQSEGITLGPGEDVSGVRLVVGAPGAVLRGTIRFEGGALPKGSSLMVMKESDNEDTSDRGFEYNPTAQVDEHGRFVLRGLSEGTHVISVVRIDGRSRRTGEAIKQSVDIPAHGEVNVTIVFPVR